MQIEERALLRGLRAAPNPDVRIVRTGIGKDAILAVLEREARAAAPALVILAGACGGLSPTAEVPPVARVIDEHGRAWGAGIGFDTAGVTLIGVDRVVATPADKAALAARTGAAIVDMESHAFAAACEARGLAWSVVRGVSDTPDETLPAEVLSWVRADGTTRNVRAAIDMLLRPGHIPHIFRVLRRANRTLPLVAARALAIARLPLDSPVRARSASEGIALTDRSPTPNFPRTTPLPPCVSRAAHVILFGGSFDPVHLGHTLLARAACDHVQRAAGQSPAILFIPAARSPHKSATPSASDPQRIAMLRLAINADRRLSFADVWTDELDRAAATPGTPSYTVDTLRRARAALDGRVRGSATPGGGGVGHRSPEEPVIGGTGVPVRLHLLMGADQLRALHRWREPREILALADPLILLRDSADAGALLAEVGAAGFWRTDETARFEAGMVSAPLVAASSTAAREALAAGRDTAGLLDPSVRRFIDERRLYGTRDTAGKPGPAPRPR